jgi:hypothetical protein
VKIVELIQLVTSELFLHVRCNGRN